MKIQGKAMWACIQAPNTKFEPVWNIDLLIEDKQVAGAKKAGLTVKKTENGNLIRFRRNVIRADGTENDKPVVVDAKKQPITSLVGNGSLVNVQFREYEWKNKFGSGKGYDLQGVQVLSLVTYREQDGDAFDVEDEDTEELAREETPSTKAPANKDAEFDDEDLPDVL